MDTTPILGLHYTEHATLNANFDKIDAAFALLGMAPLAVRNAPKEAEAPVAKPAPERESR
jgi:hypothetical protein